MAKKIHNYKFSFQEERGQSIIILAFSFVGIVFMLGLALDLGMVYIERVSLKRAIDAAVLSGVVELPVEQDAGERALEYLRLNGYDLSNAEISFAGCQIDPNNPNQWINPSWGNDGNPGTADDPVETHYYDSDGTWGNSRNSFYIDTYNNQPDNEHNLNVVCSSAIDTYGTANKLKVSGRVRVDMNFMRVVPYGWQYVDVTESGTAQNIDSLDISIVIDKSGSMEFNPVCYGCWSRNDATPPASAINDQPRYSSFYDYPENGTLLPLGYNLDADADGDVFEETTIQNICNQPTGADLQNAVYRDFGGGANPNHYYVILDAELYSRKNPPIEVEFLEGAKGYWAMQRGEGNYGDEATPFFVSNGYSIDGPTAPGAHMAHHPSTSTRYGRHYSLAEAQMGEAPVLEYDFILRNDVPSSINWISGTDGYIWVRIHRGRGLDVDRNSSYYGDEVGDGRDAYWSVYPKTLADNPADLQNIEFLPPSDTVLPVVKDAAFPADMATAANPGNWKWVRLQGTFKITPDQPYRFYFYAGSPGFSIDRIVVTNSPNSPLPTQVVNGSAGPTYGSGQADALMPTAACDPCNAIYAQNIGADGDPDTTYHLSDCTFFDYQMPTNNASHPQFDEWENPLRATKEGIKTFITFLDAERDQVGFVAYDNDNTPAFTPLECAKRWGNDCAKITNPISYTNVLVDIEAITAGNGTNIGIGMKRGLELLGIDPYGDGVPGGCGVDGTASCSRGASALPIMVVMTDGIPNAAPGGICRTAGPFWDGTIDTAQNGTQEGYDCPLYFADQARRNGVSLFVIGIGFGIDPDYLGRIAEVGGGEYKFTANGADLDQIFAGILANIYVRLVE